MADFCKQCSLELFQADTKDFAGIVTEEQFKKENLVAIGLCESCVGGQFDHEGNCLGGCIIKSHNENKNETSIPTS